MTNLSFTLLKIRLVDNYLAGAFRNTHKYFLRGRTLQICSCVAPIPQRPCRRWATQEKPSLEFQITNCYSLLKSFTNPSMIGLFWRSFCFFCLFWECKAFLPQGVQLSIFS